MLIVYVHPYCACILCHNAMLHHAQIYNTHAKEEI